MWKKKEHGLRMPVKFADNAEKETEHCGSGWPAPVISAGVIFCACGLACWVLNRAFGVGSKKAMNIAAGVLCSIGLISIVVGAAGCCRTAKSPHLIDLNDYDILHLDDPLDNSSADISFSTVNPLARSQTWPKIK